MESLYLLLPVSVLLVLGLIALFAWALDSGQFEDLEREGLRSLDPDAAQAVAPRLDADQHAPGARFRQSDIPELKDTQT